MTMEMSVGGAEDFQVFIDELHHGGWLPVSLGWVITR